MERDNYSGNFNLEVDEAYHYVAMPGDMTRYDLVAVKFHSIGGLGNMGFVQGPAWFLTCCMTAKSYLFADKDSVSEFYVGEKFGLTNPRSIKVYTELVNEILGGKERTT